MAQTDSVKTSSFDFDIGVDMMSRYVWRGIEYSGNGPSIQPSISMNYKGLEVGFWGAYSTNGNNSNQEIDFYVNYTFLKDYITIGFTDYYIANELVSNEFVNYKSDTIGHVLEGSISINGGDKIPLSLLLGVNFYGNDANRIENDPNSNKFNKVVGIQYSTYLELAYSTTISNLSFDAFAGFNLTAPRNADSNTGYLGESGYYGSKKGLVNLGFTFEKEIKITNSFSIPLNASIITNPLDKHVYFVVGLSL